MKIWEFMESFDNESILPSKCFTVTLRSSKENAPYGRQSINQPINRMINSQYLPQNKWPQFVWTGSSAGSKRQMGQPVSVDRKSLLTAAPPFLVGAGGGSRICSCEKSWRTPVTRSRYSGRIVRAKEFSLCKRRQSFNGSSFTSRKNRCRKELTCNVWKGTSRLRWARLGSRRQRIPLPGGREKFGWIRGWQRARALWARQSRWRSSART